MKSFTLILTFSIIAAFSHATPALVARPQPQMNQYYMLNHAQQQINETELIKGSCIYKIDIKTSCSSPTNSNDAIDIWFGDADGNQVLLRHSPPVKQCTTETFEIYSGCMQGKICNMYFVRIGKDGWKPESAIISYGDYPPATFNFNYFIPEGTPSGFNYC